MKKFMIFIAVTFVIITSVNLNAEISNCANMPCNPSIPWSHIEAMPVQSLACPDCTFDISYSFRVIICAGKTVIQVEMEDWVWASNGCVTCPWATYSDMFEDAVTSFLSWAKSYSGFWAAEVFEYYSAPCWRFTNWGPNQFPKWYRCPTNDCCIWMFDSEYNAETQKLELTNPVLIEPEFIDCNLAPAPFANYCYNICGLVDPANLKICAYETEALRISRPIVFPNPTKEFIEVQIAIQKEGEITFDIFNIEGNLVFQTPEFNSTQGSFKIDVSQIPTGKYFINIKMNNKIISLGNEFNVQK